MKKCVGIKCVIILQEKWFQNRGFIVQNEFLKTNNCAVWQDVLLTSFDKYNCRDIPVSAAEQNNHSLNKKAKFYK